MIKFTHHFGPIMFRSPWIKRNGSFMVLDFHSGLRKFCAEAPVVTKKKRTIWTRLAISAAVTGATFAYMLYLRKKKAFEDEIDRRKSLTRVMIGGPWELLSHDGKLTSSNDYLGQWHLIYFGFTHCPDICPEEIERMVKVAALINGDSRCPNVATLFFTVDADRDTPQAVKKYLSDFSPSILGFTGTREQVEKVCKTFRVYYKPGPKDALDDYIVDHTIIIYLVDPEGHFVDYFGRHKSIEEVASAIKQHMKKFDELKSGLFHKLWAPKESVS